LNCLHEPVLVKEVLRALAIRPEGIYVDGTLGTGGHGLAMGQRLGPEGMLIALDVDPTAIQVAKERLKDLVCRREITKASYANLDEVLLGLGITKVDGVFLDLGMSSFQLDYSGRGFSFLRDEPLDMRMDPDEGDITAAYLLNTLSQQELEDLLRRYGEERKAKRISKAIIQARSRAPIETSSQLASLVRSVYPKPRGPVYRHPATRTFQALRIAVNRELDNLKTFLEKVPELLKPGGRVVILSYHSLEDRMVKQAMVSWEKGCICPPDFPQCVCGRSPLLKRLYRKAKRPSQAEMEENPRARSAILRAAERVIS